MLTKKIEISHRTILFIIAVLIGLWAVWLIRDVLFQLLIALILMAILNPFVTKFEKFGIPRAASILLAYILFIGLVVISFAGIVPPLIEQTTQLVNRIPALLDNVAFGTVLGERILNEIVSEIGRLPAQIARAMISIFSNVFEVITTLIFAFYLLLSRNKLDQQLGVLLGVDKQKEIIGLVSVLEDKLGGWLRGQLSLMLLVGVTTYIGLVLLGVPFALPLAILAGLLEVIPYLGPVVSAIPAVIIAMGISPLMGLAVLALATLVQQLENYVFVPKVMEKTVGLTPIVTLLALAIGYKLAGLVGILMSVPIVLTLQILVKEYVLIQKQSE